MKNNKMNNYEKPVLLVTDDLAEGIYMSSGVLTLGQLLNGEFDPEAADGLENPDLLLGEDGQPILGPDGEPILAADGETVPGEDGEPADGAENSDGVEGDDGVDPAVDGAEAGTEGADAAEGTDTEGADITPAAEDQEPEHDNDDIDAETNNVAVGAVPSDSNGLGCQSIYMRGIWQGRMVAGGFSNGISFKDKFGCAGCSKDNGDGCKLINDYIATGHGATFRNQAEVNSAKPRWEQEGHSGDEIWKNTMPTY